jgi:hypothetical protein
MIKTKKNRKQTKKLTMCKGRYALCTSAPCRKIKNKQGKTSCKCIIENGYNFATKSCNRLKPHKMQNGTRRIYSTFSINELKNGKKITECPKQFEWSDCLNHKCVVDPNNSKKAICECTLRKSNKNWFTMGSYNNNNKCSSSKWSGAHKNDFYATRKFWNNYFNKKPNHNEKLIGKPNTIINKLP